MKPSKLTGGIFSMHAQFVNSVSGPVKTVCLGVLMLLAGYGCSSVSVFEPKDGAPRRSLDPNRIKDAVPRRDPITRAGNKNPYTVFGKTYRLLPTSKNYRAEGIASWYGTKFHGRPTANGERYSLYAMTAAHKTLPIPAYARVTNLANGKTAVVRVNDRGPFHDDRLIDLSYAAAVKLGFAKQGTARVRVEVIEPGVTPTTQWVNSKPLNKPLVAEPSAHIKKPSAPVAQTPAQTTRPPAPIASDSASYFLQVASFQSLELANRLRAQLILATNQRVQIASNTTAGMHRVQVGPLDSMSKVQALSELLIEAGHGVPRLIRP